jgi:hypothetical protein
VVNAPDFVEANNVREMDEGEVAVRFFASGVPVIV